MTAKEFLIWYKKASKKYSETFLAKWQSEAGKAGQVPEEMVGKFADLYPRGKMLRGALSFLGYQVAGGKRMQEILKASIFVELFNTAILICDDVFDSDKIRRGLPTIHEQWKELVSSKKPHFAHSTTLRVTLGARHYGHSMGINTGIMGFYLAQIPLLEANFSIKRKHKALLEFSRFAARLAWGEGMDISSSYPIARLNLAGNARKIHQLKTVEYTGIMPLKIGAVLAGASQKKLELLGKYGESLGRVFQIQDDIIGSFGDPVKTGKSNTSDISDGRWTVLVEILWEKADKKDKQVLRKIFEKSKRGAGEIKVVKSLMVKYEVVGLARERAQRYLRKGLGVVPKVTKDKEHQDTMENLLYFMISRTK